MLRNKPFTTIKNLEEIQRIENCDYGSDDIYNFQSDHNGGGTNSNSGDKEWNNLD